MEGWMGVVGWESWMCERWIEVRDGSGWMGEEEKSEREGFE